MKAIQVFLQGGRHKKKGQPCEDRTLYLHKNGVHVIALADGAGSAKYTHSAQGAECVCEAVCKFFCNNFDKFYQKTEEQELKSVIVAVCQKQLQQLADRLQLDNILRLSSTLLCAAVKGDRVIVCHIGDGVIGKLTTDGTKVVSAPDNGEFAGTTYFITNAYAFNKINIYKEKANNVQSYFLMSDGTADYIYDDLHRAFHDAARKMAMLPNEEDSQKQLETTVADYMVNKDSNSDDCSFICLSLADSRENVAHEAVSEEQAFEAEQKAETEDENLSVAAAKTVEIPDDVDELMRSYEKKTKASKGTKGKKKSKKNNKIAAIVIVGMVLAGCTAVGFVWKNHKKDTISKTTASQTVSSTTATATKETTTEANKPTNADSTTKKGSVTTTEANKPTNADSTTKKGSVTTTKENKPTNADSTTKNESQNSSNQRNENTKIKSGKN